MKKELNELKYSMWFNRGILLFLTIISIGNFMFNTVMYLGIEKFPAPDGSILLACIYVLAAMMVCYLISAGLGFWGIEIKLKRVNK